MIVVIQHWLVSDDVDIIGDLKSGWRDVIALHTEEGLVAETFVSFPHWWWTFNKTEKEDCSRECGS